MGCGCNAGAQGAPGGPAENPIYPMSMPGAQNIQKRKGGGDIMYAPYTPGGPVTHYSTPGVGQMTRQAASTPPPPPPPSHTALYIGLALVGIAGAYLLMKK